MDPLEELVNPITEILVESPPISMKDGGLVRDGVNGDLDELRQIAGDGKAWMARFQAEEIERTGMPGLKIGFTPVFGYYLEVPVAKSKKCLPPTCASKPSRTRNATSPRSSSNSRTRSCAPRTGPRNWNTICS